MDKRTGLLRGTVAVLLVLGWARVPAVAQESIGERPNLNGIWQVLNNANQNIQDHNGELGVPPGQGVVVGNEIPYRPEALAKKAENYANRETADLTEAQCFLPGVPRATYMPFPFQITHTPTMIAISYEFAHAMRPIVMDGSPHPEVPDQNWMGISRGHWEGDTLVVDIRNFNDQTWFDHAGNYHSEQLQVTERYTLTDPDHIMYEATIEDPAVFTRPWTMSMPLYRRKEPGARLLEYDCVFYLQELIYKDAPFF